MKTTVDAVDVVWSYVNASSLKTTIAGKIYKNVRPVNNKTEDILINCLPITGERLQEAVVNVNIYVPNPALKINEVDDRTQANQVRLKQLATLAWGILDNVFVDESGAGYGFDVQQQLLIQNDEADEWYLNFRIAFYSVNLN